MAAGLSARQKLVMRDVYGDLMHDRCSLQVHSVAQDADSGEAVASWSIIATNVPCGFEFSPFKFRSRELTVPTGGLETSEILVRCRLPIEYYDDLDQNDRIILTDRFGDGDYPAPETYEIQGFLERGPAGLIANLKRIEP